VRLYESVGFETAGATRVTIAEKEVGEDLVMVLDKATMQDHVGARRIPR
jgi:hypothetical protein